MAASIKIRDEWGKEHDEALEGVKGLIRGAVTLAYPDLDKVLCVFTDASDEGWGAIITQIPSDQRDLNPCEQDHEPLAFLGGLFRGSELNWATIDKEANALIKPFQKQTWMLEGRAICLYTDHLNLKYIFSTETEAAMKRSTSYRLQGYADLLKRFDYTIYHIQGKDNVWADLISRMLRKDEKVIRADTRRMIKLTEKGKAYQKELRGDGEDSEEESDEEEKDAEEKKSQRKTKAKKSSHRKKSQANQSIQKVNEERLVGVVRDPFLPD
jgi:hypothetical protein